MECMGFSVLSAMKSIQTEFVDVSRLQVGMYVELELGWMDHPFPKGSFKISSEKQIQTLGSLGLTRVKYVPVKSDTVPITDAALAERPDAAAVVTSASGATDTAGLANAVETVVPEGERMRLERVQLIKSQQQSLIVCEQRFGDATHQYTEVVNQISQKPHEARQQCQELVGGFVGDLASEGEFALRLLSESAGDKASMHSVHVTVLSLLLGKSVGLSAGDMQDLGMAAFLHDVGKTRLPERVRALDEGFSPAEYKLYQEHVAQGVFMGKRMELSAGALKAIGQHHEMIDASGFPGKLKGDSLSMPGKILALVNRYENLCNPAKVTSALTPHEALSVIFAQLKTRFDSVALSAFIRMMGVYPPGSVVQLVDDRFALVVSVNSSRPLKPRVIVHEPSVSRHEALILDLEHAPTIGIRRSLKPSALPREAAEYLSPRQRISYFFEKTSQTGPGAEPA
jgi:HD-GYP domain-containing protein (c-di-GMP phosphodiesterase class II)